MRRVLAASICLLAGCMPPDWGANAVLHPGRRALGAAPALAHKDVVAASDGAVISGWLFPGAQPRRGLLVYLHGLGDNRQSGVGLAQRFGPKGWDVLAYDSRAHGASTGDACTYGFFEKRDLSSMLDAVGAQEAIVFGSSLGAAVALQASPAEPRIRAVVAQSPFADLRRAARERAPFVASRRQIEEAIRLAERDGRFVVDAVSPLRAAPSIRVPVLVIHGTGDRETPVAHSKDVFAALGGPKRLLLVEGAGHNDTLAREETWQDIEKFVADPAGYAAADPK